MPWPSMCFRASGHWKRYCQLKYVGKIGLSNSTWHQCNQCNCLVFMRNYLLFCPKCAYWLRLFLTRGRLLIIHPWTWRISFFAASGIISPPANSLHSAHPPRSSVAYRIPPTIYSFKQVKQMIDTMSEIMIIRTFVSREISCLGFGPCGRSCSQHSCGYAWESTIHMPGKLSGQSGPLTMDR